MITAIEETEIKPFEVFFDCVPSNDVLFMHPILERLAFNA